MKPSRCHCRRILPLASASLLSIALVQTASATVSVVPELITLGGTNGLINIYEIDLRGDVGYSVDILDDTSDLVINTLVISFFSEFEPSIFIRPDLLEAGASSAVFPSEAWDFFGRGLLGLDVSFSDAFNSEDNAFMFVGDLGDFFGRPMLLESEEDSVIPVSIGFINTENDIDGPPELVDGGLDLHFVRGGMVASDFIAFNSSGQPVSWSSSSFSAIPEPSSALLIPLIMGSGMMFRFRPRR